MKISGIAPDLKVVPDVGQLLEKALKGTVREKTEGLLKSVLGGDDTERGKKTGGLLNRLRNP